MDEEPQVRGCYNITFICTPTRKQCPELWTLPAQHTTFNTLDNWAIYPTPNQKGKRPERKGYRVMARNMYTIHSVTYIHQTLKRVIPIAFRCTLFFPQKLASHRQWRFLGNSMHCQSIGQSMEIPCFSRRTPFRWSVFIQTIRADPPSSPPPPPPHPLTPQES